MASQLFLPDGYVERSVPQYFNDAPLVPGELIHQPEVYDVADYLIACTGRSTVIDIGCGRARKLMKVRASQLVGVDFGTNITFCRQAHGDRAEWIETDLSEPSCVELAARASEDTIVICADVVGHLPNPIPLLNLLSACYRRGAIVLTSTPDRLRVRGGADRGPPPNPSHVREWERLEFRSLLEAHGLPAIFCGYTINNNVARELKTIVTVHDRSAAPASAPPLKARPLAIMSVYNENDVLHDTVADLVDQGCDVHIIDNWSNDGGATSIAQLMHHFRDPASKRAEPSL